METKYVKVPFEVELAKKITNGEVEGRIIDNDENHYRLVCFDLADDKVKIIGLRKNNNYTEKALTFNNNGYCVQHSKCILSLEIPEYMTFKDGDVIAFGHTEKSLAIGIFHRSKSYKSHECYVKLDWSGGLVYNVEPLTYNNARYATEEEKQRFIKALKESSDIEAKECLKMLGIEVKPKCEFKPFDKVLVRDSKLNEWKIDIFREFIEDGGSEGYRYNCFYDNWNYCIPYNEQTAHLLGTTDNWEEKI